MKGPQQEAFDCKGPPLPWTPSLSPQHGQQQHLPNWDGLWGAQMCSLPTDTQCSSCKWGFSQGMEQRAALAARSNPCQDRDSPMKWPLLPISSSPEFGCSCIPPSFPPAWPQSKSWDVFQLCQCGEPSSFPRRFAMAGNSDRAALLPPNITEPGVLSLPALTGITRRCSQQCRDG